MGRGPKSSKNIVLGSLGQKFWSWKTRCFDHKNFSNGNPFVWPVTRNQTSWTPPHGFSFEVNVDKRMFTKVENSFCFVLSESFCLKKLVLWDILLGIHVWGFYFWDCCSSKKLAKKKKENKRQLSTLFVTLPPDTNILVSDSDLDIFGDFFVIHFRWSMMPKQSSKTFAFFSLCLLFFFHFVFSPGFTIVCLIVVLERGDSSCQFKGHLFCLFYLFFFLLFLLDSNNRIFFYFLDLFCEPNNIWAFFFFFYFKFQKKKFFNFSQDKVLISK